VQEGLQLSLAFVALFLGLTVYTSAFIADIVRAGIQSVPSGQIEAARSQGFKSGQVLSLVVLPQALRLTIPPLTNRTIAITKGTALASVVAVSEILGMASSAVSNSYNPSPLTLGAIAYLILFFPMVVFGRWLETRMAWKR
jgi:polar amino acid transport system permease protein